jgi:hypothetical protein
MELLIGLWMAFCTSCTSLLAAVGAPRARCSYALGVHSGRMMVQVWRSMSVSVDSSCLGVLRGKCSFKCANSACLAAPVHACAG